MRKPLPLHDIEGRGARIRARVKSIPFTLPENVEQTIRHACSQDGYEIPIYHYHNKENSPCSASNPGPAVVHIHGGGYNTVSAADITPDLMPYVLAGAEILSVDYRLAPENPFPIPVEDCWAALARIRSNAVELGIDPSRIALFAESPGGGGPRRGSCDDGAGPGLLAATR